MYRTMKIVVLRLFKIVSAVLPLDIWIIPSCPVSHWQLRKRAKDGALPGPQSRVLFTEKYFLSHITPSHISMVQYTALIHIFHPTDFFLGSLCRSLSFELILYGSNTTLKNSVSQPIDEMCQTFYSSVNNCLQYGQRASDPQNFQIIFLSFESMTQSY